MEVLYLRCAGLDVHKESVVACVRLAHGGRVDRETRRFATTTAGPTELTAWLAENGVTHVAMEATGVYWKPVWHILADGPFELRLANAAHVKNVPGRKSDVSDAAWLADLLAHGLIRASFVPDAATQELRSLLRLHLQQIEALDAAIAALDQEVEDTLAPFRAAVQLLDTIPGVNALAAEGIVSEIGTGALAN